ncbi:MAG: hypothetical protein M9949_06600 [Candidatus Kapabacteria bacterium]|nr:hypothetical protein [Candidatus Kapabacteria bacterium]
MPYNNMKEEELKNRIARDFFWQYDWTKIIGNVDFCVAMYDKKKEPHEQESLLWAEAKAGIADPYKSIAQLVLTIGKARTFDKYLPPVMLGALDLEKIAFIPYNDISEIFYINDFNWNVAPSNHDSKEFQIILNMVRSSINQNAFIFYFDKDAKELQKFIKENFIVSKFGVTKIRIDKNNFMVIYNKWLTAVKPTIAVNWQIAQKTGIIDGDFYLADLLSEENNTIKEKLFVLLKKTYYELDRKIDKSGMFSSLTTSFNDEQTAHNQFWNKYERPPKEEYWDYIVERRDLLVPQDVRERKGSFFTPQIWVELSQKYLTDVLGEDWQDEYYIWDCAAGTGNLLTGLTNKYNIWASTLDTQDVEVMRDRIKNGANLLEDHVFQFDFLNDEFTKLPKPLLEIINDPEKRKKLVIYINPPYAEHTNKENLSNNSFKENLAQNKIYYKYADILKKGNLELFIQFLTRIYFEIPSAYIGEFSKLKAIQSPNFNDFRNIFRAKIEKAFIVEADTFDNVKGKFPIGFKIWNLKFQEYMNNIKADIFDKNGNKIGTKRLIAYDNYKYINDWIRMFKSSNKVNIGILHYRGNDFQHQSMVYVNNSTDSSMTQFQITESNIYIPCIYLTMRTIIKASWLNDRDQFLYPNDGWKKDKEFQNDCLTYTLFNNNIQSNHGTNFWIPFTEQEVNAREKFDNNFMTDFIKGKSKPHKKSITTFSMIFEPVEDYGRAPLKFSPVATAVFDAGRELWKYYHAQPNCNVNASLYDIREHFQGRNATGKMNNKSDDAEYMRLIGNLRDRLKLLAKKIEPKVYEYGFLKG